jgi:hypothetical protein
VLLGLVVLAGCIGGKKFGEPLAPARAGGPRVYLDGGDDPLKAAHMSAIASLHERAIGPLLARSDKGALAAYVAGAESGPRTVVAIELGADGMPKAQAHVIAEAAADTSSLVVKHVSDGFLLAWTSLTDRGDSLNLVGTNDAGEARGSAIELARTNDHIVWVEIVATSHGAVCVWAEEGATGGGANVLTQALEATGRPRGVPSRIIRGAASWQAVPTKDGVELAIVQSGGLSLARLDTEGRVVGEPIPVAKAIGNDMDMVRAADGFVFAWTDRTRVDPQLVLAGVDAQNKVIAPHDALPDAGSSSLVGMASGDAGALIMWEPSHKRERLTRRVHVGLLPDAAGAFTTKTTLDLTGGASIEARGLGDGWAILGTARACTLGADSTCGAAAPMFLRLDASFAVVQSEALVQGPAVSLAWGIECAPSHGCLALAAGPDAPTTVYAMDLSERPSTHAPPVTAALPDDAPRLASTHTLATSTQVGDVASVRVGETTLVAAIVSTGVDEKTHEERLALRITPVTGGKALPAVTLSQHALLTGGVSMVRGPGPKEATLAYVAKDNAGARVHIARIDEHGARRADTALPGGAKGDASDVSLTMVDGSAAGGTSQTRTDGGFIVAWVDTRDGNGEVYAAKLGNDLTGPQTRITNAPGDATDTALVALDGSVVLAWADPRESPHDGFADIYAVALSSKSGKPLGKEGRVLSTAAHSRSPTLAKTPLGAALAWIEEAPAGAASDEAKGAMFALLDERAHPVRDPIKLRLHDEGIATAIALDADASTRLVHAVIARSTQDELWLDGARIPLDAGGVESYPLVALDGPSSMDVALVLRGDELIFSDEGGTDDARIRRGMITWKK